MTLHDTIQRVLAEFEKKCGMWNPLFLDLGLSPREKEIMDFRYGSPRKTLEETGKTFGVTRERIRQIEAKAMEKLRETNELKSFISQALTESLKGAFAATTLEKLEVCVDDECKGCIGNRSVNAALQAIEDLKNSYMSEK